MELRVLRYFLAICQEKNISKAAAKLHLSQPSLSKQVKELEEELGVTLFTRGHRQITLTESGYYLRDRAQEMIAIADSTTQALGKDQIISGQLNIGAGQSPALEPLMKIIDTILAKHPQIQVNFKDDNADNVERLVASGSLDFGIIMGNRTLHDFNSIILPARNQFVAVFSPQLPLSQLKKITPADLVHYPVMVSSQSYVSDKFRKWWGNRTDQVQSNFSANLAYNSSLLAKQGHQVMITYAGLVNTAALGLIERPLSPKITDPNILIWKKNVAMTNLENLFIDQVQGLLK